MRKFLASPFIIIIWPAISIQTYGKQLKQNTNTHKIKHTNKQTRKQTDNGQEMHVHQCGKTPKRRSNSLELLRSLIVSCCSCSCFSRSCCSCCRWWFSLLLSFLRCFFASLTLNSPVEKQAKMLLFVGCCCCFCNCYCYCCYCYCD